MGRKAKSEEEEIKRTVLREIKKLKVPNSWLNKKGARGQQIG
ncbi:24410_t:CDS:1, partial [Gigaspora rosea]